MKYLILIILIASCSRSFTKNVDTVFSKTGSGNTPATGIGSSIWEQMHLSDVTSGTGVLFDTLPITKENGLSVTPTNELKSKWADVTTATRCYNFTITFDTVRVIMLVCDTSFIEGFGTDILVEPNRYSLKNRMAQTWWQFGYMTQTNVQRVALLPATYLDENKKPLSKNLIVWVSKEIQAAPSVVVDDECKHRQVSSTLMDCNLPPCNTCTCQECGKSWPCN